MGTLIRWALIAAVCSCAELEERPANVCGNGVVESPREDCDTIVDASSTGSGQASLGKDLLCAPPGDLLRGCHFVCGASGPPCPAGWTCSREGLCRYPSGTWAQADALSLPGEFHKSGDLDGDGRSDLIGIRSDRLTVRFGSEAGLTEPYDFAVALAGVPAVDDMDLDGREDVVAPMFGGQLSVLLGERSRTLAPVPYAALEPASSARFSIRPIRTRTNHPAHGFLFFFEDAGRVLVTVRDFADESGAATSYTFGASTLEDLAGRQPIADLDGDGDEEIVLAVRGSPEVSVLAPRCTAACGPVELDIYDSVIFPGPVEGVSVADVDGDGRPDLLGRVGQDVAVARADLFGGFQAPTIDRRFDALLYLDVFPIREDLATRWPIASGDFDGDGAADFVSPNGVYSSVGPDVLNHRATNVSSLGWAEAVVSDFNRDGFEDLAAATAGLQGIDLFLGDGTGRFSSARVETPGPVSSMRVGDFDGDRVGDLAFVMGSGRDQQPAVLFGTLEGSPLPPVAMGRLGGALAGLEAAKLYPGPFFFDVTDDLVVITSNATQSIAFLTGARERRMLSPLLLSVPEDARGSSLAVATGRFAPGGTEPDVAVIDALGATLVEGSPEARFHALRRLDGASLSCFSGLDPVCAHVLAGNVDDDPTSDEILLVPGSADCAPAPTGLRVATALFGGAPRCRALAFPDGFARPSRVLHVDLDRNGARDLVIAFEGRLAVARDFMVRDEAEVSFTETIELAGLLDVAAIQADRFDDLELSVLTPDAIALVELDGGAVRPIATFDVSGRWYRLLSIDVDGDSLDDLAVSDGSEVLGLVTAPSGASP
ncbi:MAG: VCBS repeat-containing protein [Deltaproteobacteria bacterium]|nr:VCBS repeat-containing protein [Deltaproteobacteria bacterium]